MAQATAPPLWPATSPGQQARLDPPGWPCARNPGDPVPLKKLDSLLIDLIHENINILITRPQLYIYYKCHRITWYAFRYKTCGQWSKMVFRNAGFSMNLQNNKLVRLHLPRHVINDMKTLCCFEIRILNYLDRHELTLHATCLRWNRQNYQTYDTQQHRCS